MAAPNIVNVTTIIGKTVGKALTASLLDIVTNSAASNKVFKINSIIVSNVHGTNNAEVNVVFYDSSEGAGTNFYLAKTIIVPADSSLVVISKDANIYLEEGDIVRAQTTATSLLEIVVSYEEIS
jgi:hypothetical protein